MHKIVLASALVISTSAVLAQQGAENVQRSSNPQGVHIQGSAQTSSAQNINSSTPAESNTPKNSAAAANTDTQIQGNTKINAQAKNLNAVSVGQGNTSRNKVGTIGGD
ncbi:MAG: hypothetical protein WAZ34_11685 [Rhodocyclaceae bacterium]